MKIAIVGPGRSGKDSAAEFLSASTRLRYSLSTSAVIAPYAAAQLGLSVDAAFARRHEDRALWRRIGDDLRQHDPAFLARRTLLEGDICVGVRSRKEIRAVRAQGLVQLVLWVDRDVPEDSTLEYGPEEADAILPNHWGLPELHARLRRLAASWGVLRA